MATLVSTIACFRDNPYESSSTMDDWKLPLVQFTFRFALIGILML